MSSSEVTSREAADALGVSVQAWHRLTVKHGVQPARSLPGLTGAKLWHSADVDRLARLVAAAA